MAPTFQPHHVFLASSYVPFYLFIFFFLPFWLSISIRYLDASELKSENSSSWPCEVKQEL